MNGTDDLFTDGEDPAFVPLVAFQSQNHNWFRLRDYEVTAQQRWTVQLRNENTDGARTSSPSCSSATRARRTPSNWHPRASTRAHTEGSSDALAQEEGRRAKRGIS